MDGVPVNRTNGMKDIDFLVADLVGLEGDHWLHRYETEQLHQVILHHVTQGSGVIVIAASMFDPDRFDSGDGDAIHITPVPKRLKEWIGKSEGQNVLHRFLSQIMVNAEDLGFLEIGSEDGIQVAGGFQVIANRFLDHNPSPFPVPRQSGLAEVFGISPNMVGGVAM